LASPTTIGGNEAFHKGNDGSGSGLNADTLDGKEANQIGTSVVQRTPNGSIVTDRYPLYATLNTSYFGAATGLRYEVQDPYATFQSDTIQAASSTSMTEFHTTWDVTAVIQPSFSATKFYYKAVWRADNSQIAKTESTRFYATATPLSTIVKSLTGTQQGSNTFDMALDVSFSGGVSTDSASIKMYAFGQTPAVKSGSFGTTITAPPRTGPLVMTLTSPSVPIPEYDSRRKYGVGTSTASHSPAIVSSFSNGDRAYVEFSHLFSGEVTDPTLYLKKGFYK
ncbi:MAG: hypothetical protein ABEI52_00465, partial [Halobacteriaceae archaeon]